VSEHSVSDVLDLYAPAEAPADIDWEDVLRRAERTGPDLQRRMARRRPRRRALLALAAAGAVLLFLFATPAFGLRQAILDFVGREDVDFEQSAPAPLVVKREFADLAIGAPPTMNPQVIPNQTRRVIFDTGQREHELFVTPTKRGGFCYTLKGAYGGCQRNGGAADRTPPLTLTYMAGAKPGEPFRIQHVGGTVLDGRITRVTIEFNDGSETDVRFVWISAPINAGFFAYDLPRDRQEEARGPRSVVARAADGTIIHRDGDFRYEGPGVTQGPPPVSSTPAGRNLPTAPPVPPSAPIKKATDHGATIIVGENGAALFDSTQLDPEIRRLLANHSAGFGCFRIATQYGATYARGYAIAGRFADKVGVRFNNLGPLDGCEIQGSYGHRWPDKLGSHSAVEFAFTTRAQRYFSDRAAARDLALFVRTKEMQRIRRLDPAALTQELASRYSGQIVALTGQEARPPAGKIGYWIGPEQTVFSRISDTGRRLYVEIKDGRIDRHNLEKLAKVF
jgi:hypothetical protein